MRTPSRHVASLIDLPSELAGVAELLTASLARVSQVFDEQLRSDLPPVTRLCQHVERYRGKMIRPTLTILSGLAAHPRAAPCAQADLLTDDHFKIGAVCEMVHMATLVHDDILDDASTRRRGATINALHGNEPAVMLGDYLLASAYHLCSTLPDPSAALTVARASVIMCSGELLQLHHREDWSLDEATYFEIVARKTGELIAASASLGAACSGATQSARSAVEEFALQVGIAFQIQDDLLDLTGDEATVGKTLGRDLFKGKLTLPLIHHLSVAGARVRLQTLRTLEAGRVASAEGSVESSGHDLERSEREIRLALGGTGSIDHARTEAKRRVTRAISALGALPDSPSRELLTRLAEAVIARTF